MMTTRERCPRGYLKKNTVKNKNKERDLEAWNTNRSDAVNGREKV
jgi:hypothetical protein